MTWKHTLLLCLLMFAHLTILAQNRCRIFGTIRDEEGSPIELAAIRVQGQNALTTSNLKGEYSIYCSSRDTVTVVYSMIGYETRKRRLSNLLRIPAGVHQGDGIVGQRVHHMDTAAVYI